MDGPAEKLNTLAIFYLLLFKYCYFVAVSKALGANASKITSIEEFETEFKKALTADGPTVLDVMIDSEDKVWPMVAPGAAIDTCFTDKDLDN